jgi:uncharacterized protein
MHWSPALGYAHPVHAGALWQRPASDSTCNRGHPSDCGHRGSDAGSASATCRRLRSRCPTLLVRAPGRQPVRAAQPEIADCAALVRFAFREALRPHTTEWVRHTKLPGTPTFPDVRSAPRPGPDGWPLFRVSGGSSPRYAEFADARTIVSLNTRPIGRETGALQPGDLLYYSQPEQAQPDHLMVFLGRSTFEPGGNDWVVYHTGPLDDGPGEVRKVRLTDLERHPAPRWRPVSSNRRFVGIFRLSAWS